MTKFLGGVLPVNNRESINASGEVTDCINKLINLSLGIPVMSRTRTEIVRRESLAEHLALNTVQLY